MRLQGFINKFKSALFRPIMKNILYLLAVFIFLFSLLPVINAQAIDLIGNPSADCTTAYNACMASVISGEQQCESALASQCNYDLSFYGTAINRNDFDIHENDTAFSCGFITNPIDDINFHPSYTLCAANSCSRGFIQSSWILSIENRCKQFFDQKAKCDSDLTNCGSGSPATPIIPDQGPSKDITRPITARQIVGTVEYSTDGKTFYPLTAGTVVQKGYFIRTSFDSSVYLDFGYGQLFVTKLTELHLDEFVNSTNIQKSQLFLRVGAIAAKVNKTANIRSDFSIVTPTATASPRGTQMVVQYDNSTNTTTVYTIEGSIDTQGTLDTSPTNAQTGQKVVVDRSGTASMPVPFITSELPVQLVNYQFPSTPSSAGCCLTGFIVIFVIVGTVYQGNKNQMTA